MTKMIYTKVNTPTPTFRTKKFGNLFSDTYQGEVYDNEDEDGTWSGWCINLSGNGSDFRIDFISKTAATRWVNEKLRRHIRWNSKN